MAKETEIFSNSERQLPNNKCTISNKLFQKSVILVSSISGFYLTDYSPNFILNPPHIVRSVHADSTGKMSTKLTARKRYLPRIETGVKLFNSIDSTETAKLFVQDELPGLVRAMNLYGASLRKGEYPDDISAKAEKLTILFSTEASKLSQFNNDVYAKARLAFDDYLDFAKIPITTDKNR
eukprot:gene15000-20179_t